MYEYRFYRYEVIVYKKNFLDVGMDKILLVFFFYYVKVERGMFFLFFYFLDTRMWFIDFNVEV